jgi:hypothetical protein
MCGGAGALTGAKRGLWKSANSVAAFSGVSNSARMPFHAGAKPFVDIGLYDLAGGPGPNRFNGGRKAAKPDRSEPDQRHI